MTSFTTDAPTIAPKIGPRAFLARLFGARRARPAHPAGAAAGDAEDARTRRAFVMDRLEENPDAFTSAYDVHAMMSLYPRAF